MGSDQAPTLPGCPGPVPCRAAGVAGSCSSECQRPWSSRWGHPSLPYSPDPTCGPEEAPGSPSLKERSKENCGRVVHLLPGEDRRRDGQIDRWMDGQTDRRQQAMSPALSARRTGQASHGPSLVPTHRSAALSGSGACVKFMNFVFLQRSSLKIHPEQRPRQGPRALSSSLDTAAAAPRSHSAEKLTAGCKFP